MLRRLIPQEYDFFDYFDKAADHAVAAAKLLLRLTENYGDADLIAREMNAVEHACDEVAHTTMDRLNKTFITPLDREDIHAMILQIDDVVDTLKSLKELLPSGFDCDLTSLCDLLRELELAKGTGVKITKLPVPDPSIVLEEK